MRFQLLTVLVLLNGCVCLQPVDEVPDSGTEVRDASVELPPVSSFIAPVPFDDIAERDWVDWRFPAPWFGQASLWRRVTLDTHGELLIDAVGGVVLPDAGYVSAATQAWRDDSHQTTNEFPGWTQWNGEWYRYTHYDAVFVPQSGPLQLWRLNRNTSQLELVTTVASAFDAGTTTTSISSSLMSANAVWSGSQMLISDRIWRQSATAFDYPEGRVLLAADLAELSSPREIEARYRVLADGVDGNTKLLWVDLVESQALVRIVGDQVMTTPLEMICVAPMVQTSAPITMGCLADAGIDVWVADRDGARFIGHNDVPAEREGLALGEFLAQVNPYHALYFQKTDAGTAVVQTCSSDECHELLNLFSTPPNAGIDDAGTLYIADYILDAGVRVTRFAPGAW